MKNASGGRSFHNFKRREGFMIDKIDKDRKKQSKLKQEGSTKHKEVNELGRLWTF